MVHGRGPAEMVKTVGQDLCLPCGAEATERVWGRKGETQSGTGYWIRRYVLTNDEIVIFYIYIQV